MKSRLDTILSPQKAVQKKMLTSPLKQIHKDLFFPQSVSEKTWTAVMKKTPAHF